MNAQVVEHDDIAGHQSRSKHLVEVDGKAGCVDRPVQSHDRLYALRRQGGNHRHVWAVVQEHSLVHALAAHGPAVAPRVGQIDTGLVHKLERTASWAWQRFEEGPAQLLYPFDTAFSGVVTLFLRCKSCQTVVRPTARPTLAAK